MNPIETDVQPKLASKVFFGVHDELLWQWNVRDSEEHMWNLKCTMEEQTDAPIPFVAEVSYTATTWADKQDWKWSKEYSQFSWAAYSKAHSL
jgi:DNA polymerase I-like protein with 3'-5' exonuclease and polymerase domains